MPDGGTSIREVVRHPGAVGVVAIIDERFLLVAQYRHAVGRELLEIPAGKLDKPGESAEDCAHRELEEETGYRCETLRPLIRFVTSPGFCDEEVTVFLAGGITKSSKQPEADEDEAIRIEWLDVAEAETAIRDGRVIDSKSVIGLLLATSSFDKKAPRS